MTVRAPHQQAVLSSEEAAFIRQALVACSQALDWIEKNGGEQGRALLAEATWACAGGNAPGHVRYDVSLAVDYPDFAPAARSTR